MRRSEIEGEINKNTKRMENAFSLYTQHDFNKALESYDTMAKEFRLIILEYKRPENISLNLDHAIDRRFAYAHLFYVRCVNHILWIRHATPDFPRQELEKQFKQYEKEIESSLQQVESLIANMKKRLAEHADQFSKYSFSLKLEQDCISHLSLLQSINTKELWKTFKQEMQPAPALDKTKASAQSLAAKVLGPEKETGTTPKSDSSLVTQSRKRKAPAGAGDSEEGRSTEARRHLAFHACKRIKESPPEEIKEHKSNSTKTF